MQLLGLSLSIQLRLLSLGLKPVFSTVEIKMLWAFLAMRYFVFKEFNWLNAHLFLKSLDFVPRAGLKYTFSINCCHHHVSIKSKFCAPLCVKVTKICWKIFLGRCLLLSPSSVLARLQPRQARWCLRRASQWSWSYYSNCYHSIT